MPGCSRCWAYRSEIGNKHPAFEGLTVERKRQILNKYKQIKILSQTKISALEEKEQSAMTGRRWGKALFRLKELAW